MTTTEPLLNRELIRSRRLELNLPVRKLEALLGVGGGWFHSVEMGTNHAHVTIREVFTMANALGLEPAALLIGASEPDAVTRNDPNALTADVARLGAILTSLTQPTPTSRLAGALGWKQIRLRKALEVLAGNLRCVGLDVAETVTTVQVVRRSPEPDPVVAELVSARISGNGLDPVQLEVIAQVKAGALNERNVGRQQMRESRRLALRELINAGLVVRPRPDRGSTYQLSGKVSRSLLLDPSPAKAGKSRRRKER